eukprot:9232217-Pyramimonas_sp.AAC.1
MLFGSAAGEVKSRYPSPGLFDNACHQIGRVVTDYWFKCGTQKLALFNAQSGAETFSYRYVHPLTAAELEPFMPAIPEIC